MTLLSREPRELLERIAPDLVLPLRLVTRQHIERAMILCSGNVVEAAKRLKVGRATLYRMLSKYRKDDA